MKILTKDLIKIIAFGCIIALLHAFNQNIVDNQYKDYFSFILNNIPYFAFITIGYMGILSICYQILFINDCQNEHRELLLDIEEGKKLLTAKGFTQFN